MILSRIVQILQFIVSILTDIGWLGLALAHHQSAVLMSFEMKQYDKTNSKVAEAVPEKDGALTWLPKLSWIKAPNRPYTETVLKFLMPFAQLPSASSPKINFAAAMKFSI